MTSSTALLLFTKTTLQEAVGKQFIRSNKAKSRKISQKLISNSLHRIKKSGIPYYVLYSPEQRGNSFGERLTNAIEDIFSLGYRNVIAVGNDSPQLSPQLLIHAADEMSRTDLILGPDKRGGIYLLGISQKAYNRKELLGFRWNTPGLCADFIKWKGECQLAFIILPVLRDVNCESDLQSLLKQKYVTLQLLDALLSILASSAAATIQEVIFLKNLSAQNSIGRRGPPYCVFSS